METEIQPGAIVNTTKAYLQDEDGNVTLVNTKLFNVKFMDWSKWSGMGHRVAAVLNPRSSLISHVPEHCMFEVESHAERFDRIMKFPRMKHDMREFDERAHGPLPDSKTLKAMKDRLYKERVELIDHMLPKSRGAALDKKIAAYKARQEHPLYPIFMQAIDQAMTGKGSRHGGGKVPFMEQSWNKEMAHNHGRGSLTGQSAKKLGEAARGKQGDAFIREVLGAINFAAMSIIYEQQKGVKDDD